MEQDYSYCLNKLAAKIQVANVCYDSSFSKLYQTHVRVRYSLLICFFFSLSLSASLARLFFVILFCKVSSKSLTLRHLNLFV